MLPYLYLNTTSIGDVLLQWISIHCSYSSQFLKKNNCCLFSPPWGGPEEQLSKLVRTNAGTTPGGERTQQPLQQFLLWALSTWDVFHVELTSVTWDTFWKPNSQMELYGAVLTLMLIQEEASQPHARQPSSRCVAGRTDVLSDWGARSLAPFFCHIRPTLKVALNSPAEERECVCDCVKKNDRGKRENYRYRHMYELRY